jgi:conjugal transfer pilus assembly protein TraK
VTAPSFAQQSATATFGAPAFAAPAPPANTVGPRPRKVATLKPPAKPKYDRLALHPEAAVKDTAAPEIVLPGVMKLTGANAHAMDFSRARIVDVTNGGSQTVYVSAVDLNRIQLPWANTKVVGTDEITVDKRPSSNNVYIQLKEGVKRAVQVYFEHPNGTAVLGLQLVPKQIPAQTILVRAAGGGGEQAQAARGNDYAGFTQGLMETVALGASPQGYSQMDVSIGPIVVNGLVVNVEKLFSSADRDIYVYDVLNPGSKKASLTEKEFDADNVLAISIFPKPVVAVNEHTKVIVLTRKAKGE